MSSGLPSNLMMTFGKVYYKCVSVALQAKGVFSGYNGYSATPVSVKLQAKKMLEGKSLTEGEFNFQLLNDKSEVIDTASNMQDGLISFKDIEYKSAGKYDYVIKEIKGNEKGVTYDTSERRSKWPYLIIRTVS